MQPDKIVTPGSYVDFLHYLDTVTTEEELFSRLTYWFANRNTADDVRDRFDVVEDRAKELKLWNGLDLKLERWARANKEELARIGKDAFGALICADYAAYQEGGQAQQGNAQPLKVHSARELAEMLIPPIRYIVDELVPVGLGVLVAKPKIGKSWMILDLCLAVAAGEPFLNFPTHQHGTLYLALEDGPSRMQRRIKKLMEGRQAPENMHALFDAPRMDEGLLDVLGSYLDEHPEIHLVCIDTLSKVKPKAKPFENAYDADYDYMGILKKFADSRGICLLIVHHTRKGKNMDDAFDNINGSTGIMGAADFTIVLDKQNRIVKDRLARERAKGQTSGATDNSAAELDTEKAQLEADRQKLQDERNAFECERYCKENGIDPKLVELIGNSDPEEFKEKTESLWSIFAKSQKNQPGAVAVVSTGAPHGSMSQRKEPDGAQFFKPSGTY